MLETVAARLGVSAMPVREALIALSHEGLVLALPRRGFRANPPTALDLHDLFDLHAHLAGVLAGRAATAATVEDIAALEHTQAEFEALAREALSGGTMTPAVARRLYDLNHEFHRRIHLSAEGERVRWFLKLTTRFVRRDHYGTSSVWIETTLRDHPRIIDAIRSRDAVRARDTTEAHFRIDAELAAQA